MAVVRVTPSGWLQETTTTVTRATPSGWVQETTYVEGMLIPGVGIVASSTAMLIPGAGLIQPPTSAPVGTGVTAVTLTVADAAHTQSTENVALTQTHSLTANSTEHTQSTENVALTQAHTLVVADSSHTHITDNIDLTQAHTLVVADSSHGHSVDNVVLSVPVVFAAAPCTGYLPTADSSYTDFTSSGFGTPEAAIIIVSGSSSGTNPAALISDGVGFWTPTAEAGVGISAEDALATSNTASANNTTCIAIPNVAGNGYAITATGSTSGVTDGLRITKTGGTTSIGRFCTVILLKGLTNKYVERTTLPSTGTSLDITAPGFKPDLVFFVGHFASSTGATTSAAISFGAAHNNSSDVVSQGCVAWGDSDAQSVMTVNSMIHGSRCLQRTLGNNSSVYASANSFDANGFTLTYASDSAARYFAYLALELSNPDNAYVAIKDTKTSTGTQAYTGTGFTPNLLLLIQTTLTATATLGNSGTTQDPGSISIGVTDGTTEVCTIWGSQDFVNDSNVFARRDESNILNARLHNDSVDAVASLYSFDSDGWTLDYSDGSASTRKMLAIAISGSETTTLVVADSSHSHTTDNVALTQAHTLVVADSTHSHTTDTVTLSTVDTLAVADSTHSHTTDSVALTQAHTLAVADSTHSHTTDSVALTQAHTLVVADSSHSHTTDSVALTQAHTLVVADSAHNHTADNTALDFSAILAVVDSSHTHSVDNVALTQANTLTLADSSHTHNADSISLSEAATLTVADTTHAHTVDNIVTSFEALLAVSDASHSHITYSLDLVQAYLLAVNDATHVHRADRPWLVVAGAVYWVCFDVLDASTSFDVTDSSISFDATTICGS